MERKRNFTIVADDIHSEITKVNSYNTKETLEASVSYFIKTVGGFVRELTKWFDESQYSIDPSIGMKVLLEAHLINSLFIGLGTALTNKLESYYYLNPILTSETKKITVEDKKKMAQSLTASVEGLTKSSEHMQRNITERIQFFKNM